MTPTTASRATAKAERIPKPTKADKARARTIRATATSKMEGDVAESFHTAMREVFQELANDPKSRPARKVKIKMTDGDARISVTFELHAKARRK